MVYEHRLYLPAVGPFILFSLFVVRGVEKLKYKFPFLKPVMGLINRTPDTNMKTFDGKIVDWLILFFIVLFLLLASYERNALWRNEVALWKDCV